MFDDKHDELYAVLYQLEAAQREHEAVLGELAAVREQLQTECGERRTVQGEVEVPWEPRRVRS